jgi:hypothetical protein
MTLFHLLLLLLLICNTCILCTSKKTFCDYQTQYQTDDLFISTKTSCDFKQIKANQWPTSFGCSSLDEIFLAMRHAEPTGNKVFINAGCNKGACHY